MAFCFNHFNFNVTNLETSLAFYEKALGLKENGRIEAEDGSYIIVYLGDGKTGFRLELTWLRISLGNNGRQLSGSIEISSEKRLGLFCQRGDGNLFH